MDAGFQTLISVTHYDEGEEAVLQSRCIDEKGEVQPTLAEMAKNLGVTPEYFYQADHYNGIQPWRVHPDGSINSAIVA